MSSVYIHIPFCRAKCLYCDFHSVPFEQGRAEEYVRALRREIQRSAPGLAGQPVGTIFIGGGTPSVLPEGSIRDIMGCLGEHALMAPGAEVTVEANPESLTEGVIAEAASCGVTRLSVGVQSFIDEELRTLGRPHTADMARTALARAAASGMDLSLDLMYSIPGQDMGAWVLTLDMALASGAGHISAYELTPEPGTLMYDRLNSKELAMPSEEVSLDMYHEAGRVLGAAGLEHYEVSNYALPGKRCLHNINYWRRGEYLGLGPSAVSFMGGVRTKNLPLTDEYIRAMEEAGMPPSESEAPGPEEAAREFLMLGLRTMEGVDMTEARERYGLEHLSEAAGEFIKARRMEEQGGRLCMSAEGMPLMNSVLVELYSVLGL